MIRWLDHYFKKKLQNSPLHNYTNKSEVRLSLISGVFSWLLKNLTYNKYQFLNYLGRTQPLKNKTYVYVFLITSKIKGYA